MLQALALQNVTTIFSWPQVLEEFVSVFNHRFGDRIIISCFSCMCCIKLPLLAFEVCYYKCSKYSCSRQILLSIVVRDGFFDQCVLSSFQSVLFVSLCVFETQVA